MLSRSTQQLRPFIRSLSGRSNYITRFQYSTTATSNTIAADFSSKQYEKFYNSGSTDLSIPLDTFQRRHLGPGPNEVNHMLKTVGSSDLSNFIESIVPPNILNKKPLLLDETPNVGFTESEMLLHLKKIAQKNNFSVKNLIGKGYYNTILPKVIQRNMLESPEWYTSYTPYQPEISQGRLESLLNFQTIMIELTGLPIANASLLDEGTAAAEAMMLAFTNLKRKKNKFLIDKNLFPQTKSVLNSRAKPFNIELIEIDLNDKTLDFDIFKSNDIFGCLIQQFGSDGTVVKPEIMTKISDLVHSNSKGLVSVATDLMGLVLNKPPSESGVDIALGSTQRFGVPMGFGGPHAAFFSAKQNLLRKIPGRIVGISKDRLGKDAYRLALQTREQHIKRENATSNICTSQALLANVAAMYVAYHGPAGLKRIANRIYGFTSLLANSIITKSEHELVNSDSWFDTLTIKLNGVSREGFVKVALKDYNFNFFTKYEDSNLISLSIDESVNLNDINQLIKLFTNKNVIVDKNFELQKYPENLQRNDQFLAQPVFNKHHSETSLLRYMHHLQSKDLSLADSMIPLGSCTMKLNATTEMIPMTWYEFCNIHPFQPKDQLLGYKEMIDSLGKDLLNITGFDGITFQPNSGASGEYTGLRIVKEYLNDIGQSQREICLIPASAHGTNPASTAMSGMKAVTFKCSENGNLDLADLKEKIDQYGDKIACIMITYPSTYGLYENEIKDAIKMIHDAGAQVYLDGANMNAQVGLTSPGFIGADLCHLNCHKTFAIPHGGGGPAGAMVCVKNHLKPFLPKHFMDEDVSSKNIDAVSSAAFGNALVLPISYSYIKMMGSKGLPFSSIIAILNANYMKKRLSEYFKIIFSKGSSAHEFILDLKDFKKKGLEPLDIVKRLQDYGLHAPTFAFPIHDTIMVEPTESENVEMMDLFIDSMINILKESETTEGREMIKNAPHSMEDIVSTNDWNTRGYTREQAVYPLEQLKEKKVWPTVCRIDEKFGDLNFKGKI